MNGNSILIVGDTHFHNWKYQSLNKYQKEFQDFLLSYVKEQKVRGVIFLGDIFDNRRLVDKVLVGEIQDFFTELVKFTVVYVVTGNHDYYDGAFTPLPGILKQCRVITEPKVELFSGRKLGFLPYPYWKTTDHEKVAEADLIFGHIEVYGKEYYPGGAKSTDGLLEIYSNKLYFLGHYHHPSENGPIIYVGAILQRSLADLGVRMSLILLDLDTFERKRIPLPHPEFVVAVTREEYEDLVKRATNERIIPVFQPVKKLVTLESAIKDSDTSLFNIHAFIEKVIIDLAKANGVSPEFGLELLRRVSQSGGGE